MLAPFVRPVYTTKALLTHRLTARWRQATSPKHQLSKTMGLLEHTIDGSKGTRERAYLHLFPHFRGKQESASSGSDSADQSSKYAGGVGLSGRATRGNKGSSGKKMRSSTACLYEGSTSRSARAKSASKDSHRQQGDDSE